MIALNKIAVNGWYFRNVKPAEIIKMIRSAGFTAGEFTGRQLADHSDNELKNLKKAAQEYKVEIKAVNSACDGFGSICSNFISEDEQLRQERIKYTRRCIDICARLNVPRLIVDLGSTFLYSQQNDRQEELFRESIAMIRKYAEKAGVKLCLIIVPYRRVLNSDDGFYFSCYKTEDLLKQSDRASGGQAGWVFDTANEMAGRQNMHNFSLVNQVKPYLKHGLDIVYLANHPGPMTQTLRRALYHDYLRAGYYTGADYRNLLKFLRQAGFNGHITLHLSVKNPALNELRQEYKYLKSLMN